MSIYKLRILAILAAKRFLMNKVYILAAEVDFLAAKLYNTP